MKHVKPRIAIGLSGGIDSAVATILLQRQGFEVVGLFAKSWDGVNELGECQGEQDWADAQKVAAQLEIELRHVDLVKPYWTDVFESFISGYQHGLTPNPDVDCNTFVKFGPLLEYAGNEVPGAQAFATGHYAQIKSGRLASAVDPKKDQTLFLCKTPLKALQHVLFPIGHMYREEVRAMAREERLVNAEKKGSRGICFIGKRSMKEFLPEYLDVHAGNFVHIDTGEVLAEHRGAECYTIGQAAKYGGAREKMYVVDKDVQSGTVFVGEANHPSRFCRGFYVRDVTWNGGVAIEDTNLMFKHIHGNPLRGCEAKIKGKIGKIVIDSPTPLKATGSGQIIALYSEDGVYCLGGATIDGNVQAKIVDTKN